MSFDHDAYPYKFNVDTLELEEVQKWLDSQPNRSAFRIVEHLTIQGLDKSVWQALKHKEAARDAALLGNGGRVTEGAARAALLALDSNEVLEVTVDRLPATASRRMLNRIAIHAGLDHAGIERENWSAGFRTADANYQVQFRSKDMAIMFKLAMWKRPDEDARP